MNNPQFSFQDCNDIVKQCKKITNVETVDFEIIPRQKNFIFKITTQKPDQDTLCLFAKTNAELSCVDGILYEDFTVLKEFDPGKITPKCYCGKSGLLFFEDLTFQKFQTYPSLFDLKHLQKALNVLADLHAASFAYEDKKKLIEGYNLKRNTFDIGDVEDLLWSVIVNKDRLNEVKEDLKERQRSEKFPRTLCHGNLKGKNIMFHYNNGIPDQCKLVNFSPGVYTSPLYDVLQVIFFNTCKSFRRIHFDNLLSYYYKQLEENTLKYHLMIGTILPADDFKLSVYNFLPLVKLEKAAIKNAPDEKQNIQELTEILSTSRITREDCYIVVKNMVNSSDYDLLSFTITPFNKLNIKIKQFSEEKILTSFLKNSSKKETFIFNSFIPKLQDQGISIINTCVPLCYLQKPQTLILENFPSEEKPSLLKTIQKLAKFHACTLIFEEKISQDYRVINEYSDYLFGNEIKFEEVRTQTDLFPELKTPTNEENLKKCFPKLAQMVLKPSNRFRNVVSLGEISLKSVNEDCRFVNFENIRYCPPAFDFLLATNNQLEKNFQEIYYEELGKITSCYNYKLEKFLSYQEFVESIESYKPVITMLEVLKQPIKENIAALYQVCSLLPNVE